MVNEKLIVAGFGGQGVLMIGKMVALSGMENGMEVSWLPAYGSEMRGGTATCSVNVSDEPVDSPMIQNPTALIIMIEVYKGPFNDLATQAGNERGMNMLVAGTYAAITGSITLQNLYDAIDHAFVDSKAKFAEGNKRMAKLGFDYAKEHFSK